MLQPSTSGELPAELGELSLLEKLDLWDNFLEGEFEHSSVPLNLLFMLLPLILTTTAAASSLACVSCHAALCTSCFPTLLKNRLHAPTAWPAALPISRCVSLPVRSMLVPLSLAA